MPVFLLCPCGRFNATVRKLAARGKGLTGTRCKDFLTGCRLNLLYRECDLGDPCSSEQPIKTWVEIRIVFQPIVVRGNGGVLRVPEAALVTKSALLVKQGRGIRQPPSVSLP